MKNKIDEALEIANTKDVSTPINCAVVYSISFMPNEKNKKSALEYLTQNQNAKMLDMTECGKALISLGLSGKVNEVHKGITEIWKIASKRYIDNASGDIRAFVEGADERSTFYSIELKEILSNPKILTINGIDKFVFAKNFKPQRY